MRAISNTGFVAIHCTRRGIAFVSDARTRTTPTTRTMGEEGSDSANAGRRSRTSSKMSVRVPPVARLTGATTNEGMSPATSGGRPSTFKHETAVATGCSHSKGKPDAFQIGRQKKASIVKRSACGSTGWDGRWKRRSRQNVRDVQISEHVDRDLLAHRSTPNSFIGSSVRQSRSR